MNNTQRELTQLLLKIAELYPDWRFGQIVANVAAWAGESSPGDVWSVSDDDLLRAAREHLQRQTSAIGAVSATRKVS